MRLALLFALAEVVCVACSCFVSPTGTPPCEAAWQYDAVFTGVVRATSEIDAPAPGDGAPAGAYIRRRHVTLEVSRALEGSAEGQ